MRTSLLAPLVLLSSASLVSAGFFDRLKGVPSVAQEAAPPAPPSEPSLDAFGGIVHTEEAQPVAAGGVNVAPGQGASKTDAADGASITAAPVAEEPYEGIEWKWKALRIRPAELWFEGVALSLTAVYVLISLLGKRTNKSQAVAWWKAHIGYLDEQFASFTTDPRTASLTKGDPSTYYGHASGRRNTSGLTVKITTTPRHDIAQLIYILGFKVYDLTWSSPTNKVVLELELNSTPVTSGKKELDKDFVFAIARKHAMQQFKDSRWDVASFTQISEPSKDLLPTDFAVFTEGGLLTDFFLKKPNVGIKDLFTNESVEAQNAIKWFETLVISDVPSERPDDAILEKEGNIPKVRKLVLTMDLPPPARVAETRPLVELALNLVDVIGEAPFPPELLNKTKKRRQEVLGYLLEETRKEAKQKAATEAAKIKKQAEDARLERMTPAERRKAELKAKDKELKKLAMKQQKK